MTTNPAASLRPGDVITVAETKFVVLDFIDGNPFVAALYNQGNSKFGESNDYSKSYLRNAMDNWLEDSGIDEDLVLDREIDLTTLDGYKGYGKLKVKASPLTMDEARKYAELIPNPDSWSWLATGWGGTEETGSKYAMGVNSDGDWGGYDCSLSFGVRPALVLSSSLLPSAEIKTDLSAIPTDDLMAELKRRIEERE